MWQVASGEVAMTAMRGKINSSLASDQSVMAQHFEQPTTNKQQPTTATCHCIQSTLTSRLMRRQTEIHCCFLRLFLGSFHSAIERGRIICSWLYIFGIYSWPTCNTRSANQRATSWSQLTTHATWHLKRLIAATLWGTNNAKVQQTALEPEASFDVARSFNSSNQSKWKAFFLLWCNDTGF